MAKFVLKNKYFEFNSCIRKKILVQSQELKFASPYVCIFINKVESAFLESENTKPWLRRRYIDDIIFSSDLKVKINQMNLQLQNALLMRDLKSLLMFQILQLVLLVRRLKLIFIVNPLIVISFLILTQSILFITGKPIVYSQGLRIRRLCCKKDTFEKHLKNLLSWFDKHGYPKQLVDNQIRRVLESKTEQLFEHHTQAGTGVTLVVMYHPRFHNLSYTMRKRFIYLYAKEQV